MATEQHPPGPNVHLDNAQSMLNLIFIQCGRFVKEVQANNGTGRQRLAMQRAAPAATERFHDALDELENEVRLAQMVLRRDLALLRQDRKKKEAAAKQQEAEKARLAAEARNAPPPAVMVKEEVKMEKVATPAGQVEVPAPAVQQPEKETEEETKPKKEETPASTQPPPLTTTNTTTTTTEPERDPLFDGTPTTANAQDTEFDFDAIFGTGDGIDPPGGGDMMDTSADLPFSLDDTSEGPSLLRGLEDFAKSSDEDGNVNANAASAMEIDFPMPDLPDLNSTTAPAEQQSSTSNPAATKASDKQKPEEKDTTMSGSMGDEMMATIATDDLEDLFNMDDYQTQENSSFDDAFFNFE